MSRSEKPLTPSLVSHPNRDVSRFTLSIMMKKILAGCSRPHLVIPLLIVLFRWQVIQAIAWSTMLVRYSVGHGFQRGWEMTFSGEFPCPLCRLADSGTTIEMAFWSNLASQPLLFAVPFAAVASLLIYGITTRLKPQPSL